MIKTLRRRQKSSKKAKVWITWWSSGFWCQFTRRVLSVWNRQVCLCTSACQTGWSSCKLLCVWWWLCGDCGECVVTHRQAQNLPGLYHNSDTSKNTKATLKHCEYILFIIHVCESVHICLHVCARTDVWMFDFMWMDRAIFVWFLLSPSISRQSIFKTLVVAE